MDADSVIEHYIDLLVEHEWLARGGLGWSVIRKTAGTGSAGRMVAESFGSFPEFRDVDFRESDLYPTVEVFINENENGFGILERDGIHQRRHAWLRWLSRDASLWHVSWVARGHEKFVYAENGQLLVDYPEFCMDDAAIYGDAPASLGDHLRILTAALSNERLVKRASAMAMVDVATGFRLHGDMLQGRHRALLADRLIEGDPESVLSLGHVDHELLACVAAATRLHRRQICKLVLDRLVQRYFAKWPELAQAASAAFDRDAAVVSYLMPEIVEQNIRLGREWFNGPGGTPREEDRRWMRWQAGIAVRLAIRSLIDEEDDSEMLITAKNALGKGWPELRRQILSRCSTVSTTAEF
ncbi:hypothetical protein [Nonomuraea lactucae]|uniref:hypothetical protein n=1 Tax=Nonomuraea lactucae TaxID=2249762 RepID=UPI000DE4995A|nr:hypothetical protein [Nonomuraea lactucae]